MRIFLLFFLLIPILCFSQTNRSFKPGIYKTYTEFIENKPSFPMTFEVREEYSFCEKNPYEGQIQANAKMPMEKIGKYRLKVSKSDMKRVGAVIGFSDGKDVYFSDGAVILDKNAMFAKAEFVENSHYFFPNRTKVVVDQKGSTMIDWTQDGLGTNIPRPVATSPRIDHCELITKVVSAKTCKGVVLTEGEVEKILEEDNALYMKFKLDANRKHHYKRYVSEFIKRNFQ